MKEKDSGGGAGRYRKYLSKVQTCLYKFGGAGMQKQDYEGKKLALNVRLGGCQRQRIALP